MYIVWSLALIVCGILAASSFIIAKRPDAKKYIDQLVPIQGWAGVVACCLGLWALITILLHLSLFRPLALIVMLAVAVTMTGLGFLLGYGLINQYALSKNPEAAARGVIVQQKLASVQVPLGLAGIALGVWGLVMSFLH